MNAAVMCMFFKITNLDEAVMTTKFNLGYDLPVSLWKSVAPNNSTLRTLVDRRRCVPIYEENFSMVDGNIFVAAFLTENVSLYVINSVIRCYYSLFETK